VILLFIFACVIRMSNVDSCGKHYSGRLVDNTVLPTQATLGQYTRIYLFENTSRWLLFYFMWSGCKEIVGLCLYGWASWTPLQSLHGTSYTYIDVLIASMAVQGQSPGRGPGGRVP